MNDVVIFAVLSIGAGLIAMYGRSGWLRAGTYAGLLVGMGLLWFTSMGLPRPTYLHVPNGTVLSYRLDEPNAIYLWLVPEGSAQPLALQLPWHDDVAGNLVDAARRRANDGDMLKMKSATGAIGLKSQPMFYISHTHALPPKSSER